MKTKHSPLLLGATALGAIGVVVALFTVDPKRFWANWVLWLLALLTVSLGALFIVALEHLVNAKWSIVLRRVPERLATLLIPASVIALLGLFALPHLYPGTHTAEALKNKILAGKAVWLSAPMFSLRTALMLATCLLGLWLFVGGSFKQDATKDPAQNIRARKAAPAFMFIFAVAMTIAGWDWVKGLTPEWFSDIFSVYIFAGAFLGGLAATVLSLQHLQKQGRLTEVRKDHTFNLGGFLFAFTVFWSYIGFAQYMLMWYANLPEEMFWYKDRLAGNWHTLTILLALVHFVLPFFALVTRDAKGDPNRLRRVAYLMLGGHLLDLYWLVFPILGQPRFSWPEASFLLCFVGLAVLWIRSANTKGEDLPVGDAFLRQGLEYRV